MIFVYISAIILFVGTVILVSVVSQKKENKRLNDLSNEPDEKVEIVSKKAYAKSLTKENNITEKNNQIEQSEPDKIEIEKDRVQEIELSSKNENELEDFSLDDEELSNGSADNEMDEDDLDRKFAEYQQFLRDNLNLDDDSDAENFNAENFSRRMRNDEENIEEDISESIKHLSPKMREILISNALGKRSFEDDQDSESDEVQSEDSNE